MDIQIEEGHRLNVTCDTTKGNPENTTFLWSNVRGNLSSTSAFEIRNITRVHAGKYTCRAYNTLQPTFGTEEAGSDSESFHLDVLCK